jgi:hypothetical protein
LDDGRPQIGEAPAMSANETHQGKPVLRGVFYGIPDEHNWRIKVWCPHCRDYHHHGWPIKAAIDALFHRVAHCSTIDRRGRRLPPSPYIESGYYIGLDDYLEPRRAAR